MWEERLQDSFQPDENVTILNNRWHIVGEYHSNSMFKVSLSSMESSSGCFVTALPPMYIACMWTPENRTVITGNKINDLTSYMQVTRIYCSVNARSSLCVFSLVSTIKFQRFCSARVKSEASERLNDDEVSAILHSTCDVRGPGMAERG